MTPLPIEPYLAELLRPMEQQPFVGTLSIPHPFASLCMKLTAARDHEQRTSPRDRDRKHAHDVYLLTAMLDAPEFSQIQAHARSHTDHPMMVSIRRAILEHFITPEASACRTLRDQLRGQPGEPTLTDLTRFCAVLRELFAP